MECPYCSSKHSKVIDKRSAPSSAIRRRRECILCKKRFTTYEEVASLNIMIIKKDETQELFNREKLKRGIKTACEKRPVSEEEIDHMVDLIERRIRRLKSKSISSRKIGSYVVTMLRKRDEVAYMRFASVFHGFENLHSFEEELKKIASRTS